MNGVEIFVNRFRVTINLDHLECIKEYDASGHSEPYIWSAFLRGDASTLLNPGQRIEIRVPFEAETGRGLFGDAGKGVKPGDSIPIPESLGRNITTVKTFQLGGSEFVLVGFVVVLMEEDSTPGEAIKAGHQAFAQALREEINEFVDTNLRFPTEAEVQAIRDAVSKHVKKEIKSKLSWYHWFIAQDDLIGFLGGEVTLFTAERIRQWSGEGPQEFRTPIRGTETIITPPYPWASYWIPMEVEHHYDLFWQIEVQPLGLEQLAPQDNVLLKRVENIGKKLQQPDTIIGELVNKMVSLGDKQRILLLSELEEKVKRTRPGIVRELASAWEDFDRTQSADRDNLQKSDP